MATLESIEEQIDALDDKLDTKLDALETKIDAIESAIENLELVSYKTCTVCNGVGTIVPSSNEGDPTPDPITCPVDMGGCGGTGRHIVGSMNEKD